MSAVPVVHLVDNDPRVLTALARLLATENIATAASASADEFLSRYDPAVPGCVVLDLDMPGENGLELQEELKRHDVPVPLVFLSGHGDIPASVRAMKGGALDFLTKPVEADVLIAAVRRALDFDASNRMQADDAEAMQRALDKLTPREHELLPYLVSGRINKQIAADLGVVEKTVKVHRQHVMEKLGMRSLPDLVRFVERLRAAAVPPVGRRGN